MDENLKHIEQSFLSSLDGHEEMPGAQVWDAVDKQLDKENLNSIQKKYDRLKRLAALLVLLFIGMAVYEINTSLHHNSIIQSSDIIQENKNYKNGSSPLHQSTIASSKVENPLAVKSDEVARSPQNGERNIASDKSSAALDEANNRSSSISNKTGTHQQKLNIAANKKSKIISDAMFNAQIKNVTAEDEEVLTVNNTTPAKKNKEDQNMLQENDVASETNTSKQPVDIASKTKAVSLKNLPAEPLPSENSLAKKEKTTPKSASAFSFTPFFSPDVAWYRLKDEPDNNQNQNENDDAEEIKNEEQHEFSSSYGLLANLKMGKHWGMQTGITFSNTNIQAKSQTIYASSVPGEGVKYRLNTSSGYGYVLPSFSNNPVVGDSLITSSTTHYLQYIGVPLAVTYQITKGKFILSTSTGVAANFLIKGHAEINLQKGSVNETETVEKIQGLRKIYFTGITGVGVEYSITKRINFLFAPTLKFALQSINNGASVKSYPMSLGLVTGLKITF